VEALGQYFMDVVFLQAVLSQAGPPSLTTDLSAALHMLAARMCGGAGAGARGGGAKGSVAASTAAPETPLAESLMAVRDPQELSSKCVRVA
jgi:hypothetical protein